MYNGCIRLTVANQTSSNRRTAFFCPPRAKCTISATYQQIGVIHSKSVRFFKNEVRRIRFLFSVRRFTYQPIATEIIKRTIRKIIHLHTSPYLKDEGENGGLRSVVSLFVKPLFEAMNEQNKWVQDGSAMCMAKMVECASDPPVVSFQKLCLKICKYLNNPNFLAKAALLPVVSSLSQCPQSNRKCALKDVGVIYASQIVVIDHQLQKKVQSLEAKCTSFEKKFDTKELTMLTCPIASLRALR
ncbi:Microtubule-associated protein TORTIFOLIA1 [Camellia lanceoleosa]|uniref:Microtubule-associated protein TORTIFOLIA1 n=1 Tax=Camellia lanceoleosa TaxID=1840588 RepID=A0ACC0IFR8_9ERIC|nr:Microtubule-associated protein TORTIFOLIA1 [Camellia lanceoleosa]